MRALERLAKELEAQGRFAEAIGYAERLLGRDRLREETYRLLIRLYDMSGHRADAVRTYHACATTLVRELGVEPSAATREVYATGRWSHTYLNDALIAQAATFLLFN